LLIWWLLGLATTVLIAGTGIVIVPKLRAHVGCGTQAPPVTVAAAPAQAPALEQLAQRWNSANQGTGDGCAAVRVESADSAAIAESLGGAWDPARDGVRPQVWIPESSLWLSVARGRPDAAAELTRQSTSIASSPVVLALRQPQAQALGWPDRTLTWQDVIGAFAQPQSWTSTGHSDWAGLRVGVTDPSRSTAGLGLLLSVVGAEQAAAPGASPAPSGAPGAPAGGAPAGGAPAGGAATAVPTGADASQQLWMAGLLLSRAIGSLAAQPEDFFKAQGQDPAGNDPNRMIAAFPALERDVAVFDKSAIADPMVPVYNGQSPVVADYPYTVLNSSWMDADTRAAAGQFLQYLQGTAGLDAFGVAGLRTPDRSIRDAATLPAIQGFPASVPQPRNNPNAATLTGMVTQWTALERQSNVLLAVDTSGSMSLPVPGTSMTRMQLMQQTASTGFGLLTNQSSIGLWDFSTRTGGGEFRELVPFGPATATLGSSTRRQVMLGAVAALTPGGDTPLYDTIYAAFKEMQKHWQANSTNAVLLITDGANDLPGGGLTLDQLLTRLTGEQQADRPVQVISIAVGPEADAAALQQISQVTGGRTFVAKDPAAAAQTLVLAFAGRLS